MKHARQLTIALITLVALAGCQISSHPVPTKQDASRDTSDASRVQLDRSYGQLPLSFEANQGQTDSQVKFLSRGRGYALFLTQDEAVFLLRKVKAETEDSSRVTRHASREYEQTVLRMKLEGSNPSPRALGLEPLPGIVNHFIGNNPKNWRTNIPTYKKVEFKEVYPGIDLAFYGNQGKLEYDLIVAPGADPSQIKLAFEGAKEIMLADSGDVILSFPEASQASGTRLAARGEDSDESPLASSPSPSARAATLRLQKPLVYQLGEDGHKTPVSANYVLLNSDSSPSAISHRPFAIGFEVASYDATKPLVIDPVLAYSTYVGGNSANLRNNCFAVDTGGNAYITDFSLLADFPTTPGAFQTTPPGGLGDIFVMKVDPAGAAVYSTYLGGSSDEGQSPAIAVDAGGNAYVAGETVSANFPTTPGAFQTTLAGGNDVFVTKLNPTGSALVYSTYLGGSTFDEFPGIAVDSGGNAHVAGLTLSANFPTTSGAFQTTYAGGNNDAFVTKLNPTGSALVYSTFLGGSEGEFILNTRVDGAGNAYVTGSTNSLNFPTTLGAFQTTYGGGGNDAFVTKLGPTGAAVYSTYLGGIGDDGAGGGGLAVDAGGNAYVTGFTDSLNFPTTLGAFQPTFGGFNDAFVVKLNPTGAPVFSSYLGGSGRDDITFGNPSIAVDAAGNTYIRGNTESINFPTTPGAFDTTCGTDGICNGGFQDIFITKVNPIGSALVYSTYLGGSTFDGSRSIAVDGAGNAYVTGSTDSVDFPTVNPLQPAVVGGTDNFVAKVNPAGDALVYSTYLGGSSNEESRGIIIDGSGNAYIYGPTSSFDFPTVNPFQPDASGASETGFIAKILPSVPSFNTPAASTVTVPLGSGVSVRFPTVTEPGNTSMTTSSTGPPPPSGFSLGSPPTYYEITTTATFTSPVRVCIIYDPSQFSDPSNLRLLHFENNAWVDVTTSHDTERAIICGQVSSFSSFVIAQPSGSPLTSLGPANIWVGLKNSDDVGIRFDLRAEVYRNSTQLVGSGEVASVPGGSSGFNNAIQHTITLTPVEGTTFQSGDTVSIKLFVRNACTGSGKNSGSARLWFNDSAANSRFDATIGSPKTYFLRDAFILATSAGPGPKKTIDVAAGAKCSPYKTFGTWTSPIQ